MMRAPDLDVSVPRIWCIDLTAALPALIEIERQTPRLSSEDHDRASRFSDDRHAVEWTAAHVALRLVLESAVGPSFRRVALSRSPSGRPSLANTPVDFSLSHTSGYALIAVTGAGPIGVDLERPRDIRIYGDRRAAIEAAGATLADTPLPDEPDRRFLQAWVRLEALAKAEGTGMAQMLTRAGAFGGRRGQGIAGALVPAGTAVRDVGLGPSLYAAVALPAASSGVQVGSMPADEDGLRLFAVS